MDKPRNSMIPKIMLSYAFTFMMIELADSSAMVIDGLIVSRNLGATALASSGLGNTSFSMISLLCSIFAIGIQSACSAAMSSGNIKRNHELFSGGCIAITIVAFIATLLGFLLLDPLCVLFGADGSDKVLYNGLRDYLRGWFVGIPGFIGFSVLCPIVTLDGNKKAVTTATMIESGFNIVGDLLAVKVFDLGIYGIGLSTGIGFDLSLIPLILNFFRKRSSFRFVPSLLGRKDLFGIFRTGLPRLTKYGCKMLAPLLVNRTILAIGGSTAMAAMAVKGSIGNFCLVIGSGIAESVNLLSQVFYSEKDKQALRDTAKSALQANIVLGTVFAIILFVLAAPIAGLYMTTGDSLEKSYTVTMLRLLALSIALYGVNASVLNYLQGTRKILPTHLQTASHRLIFLALSTFVLGKLFGITGLFVAIPVSELLVLLTYVIVTLISNKGRKPADALLLLPDQFGYGDDDSLSFNLTTMDEVIGISEKVEEFCRCHGIDKRRAYFASLCIEELAGNVVGHGFKKDNKSHLCEVRVMIEGDDVLLRIRDDCRYFNIKERYEAILRGDAAANIGIRLVFGIAKDVSYVNLLNTNTLIIRV